MSDDLLSDDLGDLNAADFVDLLRDDPSGADEVEAAEHAREGGPRKTVLAAIDKARGTAEPEPDEPEDPHLVKGLATAAPAEEPAPEETPEPEAEPEPAAEEPAAEPDGDAVTFVCDQWAGVSLYGKGVKFEDHRFTTSDPRKIAAIEAWGHARREA